MSGIAEVLLNLGYKVSGSDLAETEITRKLKKLGARIAIGHKAENVSGAQVVVTSTAVPQENPEVRQARSRNIPIIPRAEMLSELARLKKTITVTGTHGKTTTTSMVCLALRAAGADPTMVIGGQLKNIQSNARLGTGEYLVTEADESDGSFLMLSPLAALVTNIDTDHLDHYGSLKNLKKAFMEHLDKVPFYGTSILCADDPGIQSILGKVKKPKITYGLKSKADWTVRNLALSERGSKGELAFKGQIMGPLSLQVPGAHNVLNALAAVACGHFLGFSLSKLTEGLSSFKGVGRRMERLGQASKVTFLDDYGHHPTEIRTTLEAVKKLFKPSRLVAVFQPHRYTRTKILWKDFGPAFKMADLVYVLDIYPAGENPIPGVSSELILKSLEKSKVRCLPFQGALAVARNLKPGDLVLTIGAGDVWKIGEDLKRRLQNRSLSPI